MILAAPVGICERCPTYIPFRIASLSARIPPFHAVNWQVSTRIKMLHNVIYVHIQWKILRKMQKVTAE